MFPHSGQRFSGKPGQVVATILTEERWHILTRFIGPVIWSDRLVGPAGIISEAKIIIETKEAGRWRTAWQRLVVGVSAVLILKLMLISTPVLS